MSLTKTTTWQALYAITQVTSNTINIGSAFDVSSYYGAALQVFFGRGSGTALSAQPKIRVQYTGVASSPTEADWGTLAEFSPVIGSSIGSQAVSGTEAAGQTTVSLASGSNFGAGDFVFFHNTTLANSEWCRVQSVSGSDLILPVGLVNAQTGATCRDQAQEFSLDSLDLTPIQKLRVMVDNAGTGQDIVVMARICGVSGL